MSAMTLEQVRRWAENTPASSGWRAKERDEAVAAIDAHLTAHAQMVESLEDHKKALEIANSTINILNAANAQMVEKVREVIAWVREKMTMLEDLREVVRPRPNC